MGQKHSLLVLGSISAAIAVLFQLELSGFARNLDVDTVLAVFDRQDTPLARNGDPGESTTRSTPTLTSGEPQDSSEPLDNAIVAQLDTAAEFYNRYSSNSSEIPIPTCATETSALTRQEIQAILLEHNRSRKDADRHVPEGLPPLPAVTWDCDAAAVAQLWADRTQGRQGHSSNDWRQQQYSNRTGLQGGAAKLGENLGWSGGSDPSVVRPVVRSVTDWDSERENYNHETNTCNGVCGHYTQMVWRESTSIGCGVYRGSIRFPGGDRTWSHGYFLDCTYHNAGNFNNDPPLIDHPDWYYE
ncbi:hypothetical protein AY599_12305 [Leptolyngbya valderiana BDU 20041]|nr:hypothetical protein AY599_12305 [Leptolyngbya valderiana BDU 20041]